MFDNLCFDGILCIVFMLLGRCYEIRLKNIFKRNRYKEKEKKKKKINYKKIIMKNGMKKGRKREKRGKMRKEMKD